MEDIDCCLLEVDVDRPFKYPPKATLGCCCWCCCIKGSGGGGMPVLIPGADEVGKAGVYPCAVVGGIGTRVVSGGADCSGSMPVPIPGIIPGPIIPAPGVGPG